MWHSLSRCASDSAKSCARTDWRRWRRRANFVCVPVAQCVAVGQALRARGVAVRPFPALPHIGDALRITVGPWPLLERLLDSLVHDARAEVSV